MLQAHMFFHRLLCLHILNAICITLAVVVVIAMAIVLVVVVVIVTSVAHCC